MEQNLDIDYMDCAIEEAKIAEAEDEVPIGAVIVRDGKIIARAHNKRENSKCATHHAEILAIEEACRTLGGWRLPECTIYVTLEPCAMCATAISFARIRRIIYGATDNKGGAIESGVKFYQSSTCHHKPEVVSGILAEESAQILKDFFQKKR